MVKTQDIDVQLPGLGDDYNYFDGMTEVYGLKGVNFLPDALFTLELRDNIRKLLLRGWETGEKTGIGSQSRRRASPQEWHGRRMFRQLTAAPTQTTEESSALMVCTHRIWATTSSKSDGHRRNPQIRVVCKRLQSRGSHMRSNRIMPYAICRTA